MTEGSQRQLIVILHADVIGSTALVRRDEILAHDRMLDAFRRLSRSIEAYGGVTKELRGDALVGEFKRASDAVCAAIAFQEKNAELNVKLTDGIQPGLRIGIAIGEVVMDENMMTGAGIVLAQRLEQMAGLDGVCLQGAAYETLPERLPFRYEPLGERVLKGFEEPVRVFVVSRKTGESIPEPESTPPTITAFQNVEGESLPPTLDASIAVMPFVNIGGNPEQDYFSHGITADIHSDLTRFRNLFVSGRSSCLTVSDQTTDVAEIAKRLGVKYLVKGSVRSNKGRLRVTAELVDGGTGGILWSERYDRVLHDIFDVETEVANTIAATLSIRIEDALYERRKDCSDEQLSAYDWILRGNRNLELGGAENWSNAKREFSRALEINPESSTAYAGLSIAYGYECGELLATNFAESLDRHLEFAEKAIELDGSDSRGHYAMSCAHQFFEQWELADRHSERAVELNPSEYHNICARGYTLMCLNRFEESAATFNESLRRNPLAPNSCLLALGNIEYQEENFGQSAITLSSMTPSYVQRLSTLAAVYAQLGYKEATRSASQEFRNLVEMRPGCPSAGDSESWRRFWRILYPWGDEESFEKLLNGLGKAGLPI